MKSTNHTLVKDVMGDRIKIVDGMLTVRDGIKLARDQHLRALIIERKDEHDEYGIVTLADIAKKIVAADRSPSRVNLYEIMTKPVLKVDGNMSVKNCARLFERFGIHSAPVFENNELKGVVSYTDIIIKGMLQDEISEE